MKKRIGFVSNSSSSSFIIIGREISQDEINEENVKNIVFESVFEGDYGQLWGEFGSIEMFNAYKEFIESKDQQYDTTYYFSKIHQFEHEGEIEINPSDVEEGSKAYFGTCDRFIICTVDDMKETISWYNE